MFEMAKRCLNDNDGGDKNLAPLKKPEVEFGVESVELEVESGVEPVDGQQNDDNKNNKKRELDDNQSGDGNLAPLKKTGVEFGVEPGEPMEIDPKDGQIDPEDGDQIDPKDDGQIDPVNGLMHQLDNQLKQLSEELDEWSILSPEQPMEQQQLKQLNQPPMEQSTEPPKVVLQSTTATLAGIVCLVVILDGYTCGDMLRVLMQLLVKLTKEPRSKQTLRELQIWTEGSIGMWSLHTTVKGILETFTHLPNARSLLIDGDLLGKDAFDLGNLTNMCVALRYWPGQPTTRSIRTEFQKLMEKCGVTPERVEAAKLMGFSLIKMPYGGFQSFDLSKLSPLDVVEPIDEKGYFNKHIIPCIGKPDRRYEMVKHHEAMITLAGPLAHQLRCNRECYFKWLRAACIISWAFQGERHWVEATETTPGQWLECRRSFSYPMPRNVIQMILLQISPQDWKAPSKAPVPIKNMGTIIYETSQEPLAKDWLGSRAEEDELLETQKCLQQEQFKIQRKLHLLKRDIIRAQKETTQAEAKAAPILEKMDGDLQKELDYLHGKKRPRRTSDQIEADKAAKAAKKEAKEEAKRKR